MSMLPLAAAAVAIGVAGAHIEEVRLGAVGSDPAVELRISGPPGRVTVHREGNVARVMFEDTALGGPFAGGDRFEWIPASTSPLPRDPGLGALRMERSPGGVSLSFRVPPAIAIDVMRGPSVVTLVLREPRPPSADTVTAPTVAQAPSETLKGSRPAAAPAEASASAAPKMPEPSPAPAAQRAPVTEKRAVAEATALASSDGQMPATGAPKPAGQPSKVEAPPPSAEGTSDVLRMLFPAAPAPEGEPSGKPAAASSAAAPEKAVASSDELYRKLFPSTAPEVPETRPTPAVEVEVKTKAVEARTLTVGFLTLRPSLRMSYVRGRATLESAQPVEAGYVQVQPGLETIFWGDRLTLAYEPYVRGVSAYPILKEPTHRATARLDVPFGDRFRVDASDTFISGVLETQEVDPGYEYFFGLSPFRRNAAGVNAHIEVAPRISIEPGGAVAMVRFEQPGGFFSYDSRSALLGLGYELTPKLKTTLGYVYEHVPPPEERPLAEATARSVQATVSGEITPLLTSQLTVAYRDQTSPRAPERGRRFRGATASVSLNRALGSTSWLLLLAGRATPLSNFESNAFYVSTYAEAGLVLSAPLAISLEPGIGYRWNAYRISALELGRPRRDEIFGWRMGLRRSFGLVSFAVGYRWERRDSNLLRFDSTTDGLTVQLDVNVLAAVRHR